MEQQQLEDQPQRSRAKRIAFLLSLFSLTMVTCELIARVGLWVSAEGFSTQGSAEAAAQIALGGAASDGATEVIHPYLGWIHNPQRFLPEVVFGKEIPVNPLGFQDTNSSTHKRSADRFILGITGGSVAWHMSIAGLQTLQEELNKHPLLKGRSVEVVRLATSGYKQPQQLMALNYIHVLGGEFDAVINIDGYNEVALAIAENARLNTAISYPRAWHARMISTLDPASFADAARLLELRSSRQLMAQRFLASPFRGSAIRTLTWRIRDEMARSDQSRFGLEISRVRSHSFVNHGPANEFASQQAMHAAVVDLWFRSSVQMHHACRANDCLYLHVLQPNQYFEGSKTLSPVEQKDCFSSVNNHAGDAVREVYPALVKAGAGFSDAGVAFSDQTMLFSEVTETIYSDYCCHYNERGNIMLAQAVVGEFSKLLDNFLPSAQAP